MAVSGLCYVLRFAPWLFLVRFMSSGLPHGCFWPVLCPQVCPMAVSGLCYVLRFALVAVSGLCYVLRFAPWLFLACVMSLGLPHGCFWPVLCP